jgi:hypothetical protein
MASATYQIAITSEDEKARASKRRMIYLRPFILFYVNSLFAEIVFLSVGVFIMSGTEDLLYKMIWTLVFCPLGMGGAMGGIVNYFIVDYYYGKKAAHFTALLCLLIWAIAITFATVLTIILIGLVLPIIQCGFIGGILHSGLWVMSMGG